MERPVLGAPAPADTAGVYSTTSERHYAAFRLRHLLSLAAVGMPEDQYSADHQRRSGELLTTLIGHGDRFTYDLRLLARPAPLVPTRGRIHVCLLCRMEGLPAPEAARHARDLLRLLEAVFPEYGFDEVSAGVVPALLTRFPVRHVLAVVRRAGLARLDSLRSTRPGPAIGFATSRPSRAEAGVPADAVYHVSPLLPTRAAFTSLFELLLMASAPIAVSVRLRPAALAAEEEAFLEGQVARCERYAQVELGTTSGDLTTLQPTLREQARLYQHYQARLLWGLRANALLLTVEVASPEPLPLPVVGTVGGLITEPAGGSGGLEESPRRYLAGGYDVLDGEDGATPGRASAFADLDLVLAPHPLAPPGAERLAHLFDPVGAAAAFRFPPATVEAPAGLPVQGWRSRSVPPELPEAGLCVGLGLLRGRLAQPVRIGAEDRRRHLYVVGQTGTGKTTLLRGMILDAMGSGCGLCVIDPHGDLFRELLGKIPEERVTDVVVLDPTDAAYPVGVNLLEVETETQRHFLVQELVGILARLIEDEYGPAALGQFAGPVFFQHMRMNLLLAMSNPDDPGTLLEFYAIYQEPDYWRRWLPLRTSDPLLDRWVRHVLPKTDYTRPTSDGVSMGGYVGSKFEAFVFDPLLRGLFGQKRSTVDLRAIMDQGKILLVNLAKGELTEANARFLGMVLLAKLVAAAMGRVRVAEAARGEFLVYVDEFQSLATRSFGTLLSEARKFGLSLVLANQYLSQVADPRITEAIFGNVGTLISFRLGQADAELLERQFAPTFNRSDLRNLPNWQACMTTLVRGQTVPPFSLRTLPDVTRYDAHRARAVRARSRRAYGWPRRAVEEEIARSLQSPPKHRGECEES